MMKKRTIIENTKKEVNLTDKQSQEVINTIFDTISKALIQGENVKIRGFGTFKITNYKERNGRNPKTGEKIVIPAKRVIRLNVAKDLKNEIQKNH
ncbi:DNA-binding protein HU [Spiroplasma sp. JKS002669]|uniref:HU family DNA-binding protein n=1 Tax=Spiroplasma attinicola TaxID=2904537 RepID=UPI002022D8AA|nr:MULTISPECIES: HU family DNA-binding protein [unclassified Spiroplasma]MCL6428750.1 DNA-binding protein HU [Spiroplasma sp. JKS002669]MCL8210117.1 DNA-binding protein HU [Spiroplasma sp. JKS002670]MCL8211078.1 DNA-binding protein HU [Spiroplasma sp. JKS002671]